MIIQPQEKTESEDLIKINNEIFKKKTTLQKIDIKILEAELNYKEQLISKLQNEITKLKQQITTIKSLI